MRPRFPRIVTSSALTLTLGVVCTFLIAGPVQAEEVRLLGSTRLSQAENDKDVLRFAKCRRGIDAVQLRIARGRVEVEKVWVAFARGGRETLEVRERIGEGKSSRWIDLRGGERCLKAVGIVGDTELSFDQARVEVWGR